MISFRGRTNVPRAARSFAAVSEAKRKAKFFALMRRFNELGRLLPAPDDLDPDDAAAVAESRLVIAEMNKTQAEMDRLLDLEAAARRKATT